MHYTNNRASTKLNLKILFWYMLAKQTSAYTYWKKMSAGQNMQNSTPPFSLAYQITQECPFKCAICLRYYHDGDKPLTSHQRQHMVDLLYKHGLRRLTVTGGEPTILGDELFDFLKYVHQKRIHVCLSTTGYGLTREKIEDMNNYVDQLLISIRHLNKSDWIREFGNPTHSEKLFENVNDILEWIKKTEIRLEVSTVIHRHNLDEVIGLGMQLVDRNPDVFWRLEEYYGIGKESRRKSEFALGENEFEQASKVIQAKFGHLLPHIRFSSNKTRAVSPEYLISQSGDLVTTSDYQVKKTSYSFVNGRIPEVFSNRRPWSEYVELFRDWGWTEEETL